MNMPILYFNECPDSMILLYKDEEINGDSTSWDKRSSRDSEGKRVCPPVTRLTDGAHRNGRTATHFRDRPRCCSIVASTRLALPVTTAT
jgi:hypothetical protein